MSHFYDLETDLDTEAEEEFETLQSNTIETEEEYEEITEFGIYDETAAEGDSGFPADSWPGICARSEPLRC